MTSSIVSSLANRFLATTRCAGRSAFSSFALGLVCLAIFSPNGGILSPATPPNQRNGPSSKDAGGGTIKQFDLGRHVRPSSSNEARLKLHVPGQSPEFQRQIVSAAIYLRPQHLQIPDVSAPKPPQELAEEDVLDEMFAGAGFV